MGDDMDSIIRIGKVSDINAANRTVRVRFNDVNITSGWLKVLRTPPFIGNDDPPKEVTKTEKEAGHFHELKIITWFPAVGETVLCLYNPGFNEDGYVIGGL